ncbi:MAG: trp RNA-binding attenuation protein MtrB [Clostridiales bacterium]|nr:trp RNA-binding attenuation protein MtrB [Clostridiales bacterium]
MEIQNKSVQGEYICIQALEDGVSIIGMTRGADTRFHHTEKLDKGEVMVAQFTQNTSAMKIRGKARILTKFGDLLSHQEDNN